MILETKQFEGLLKSTVRGAWTNLDYDNGLVNVRVKNVREFEGTARMYFDLKREQVATGPRFTIMRPPYRLVMGRGFRVTSQLEFIEPIKDGYVAMVIPNEMATRVGIDILSPPMYPGFVGEIEFSVISAGYVELTDMVSLGRLMFFDIGSGKQAKAPAKNTETKKTGGSNEIKSAGSKTATKTKTTPKKGPKKTR